MGRNEGLSITEEVTVGMKLSIRRATPADIGVLAAMVKSLHEESDVGYPQMDEAEIEKMMFGILESLRNPECLYLMAYDGKRPAGMLIAHVGHHAYGKPGSVGVAEQLYVVPEKRGGPVGFSLIRAAVKHGLEMGVDGFEAVGVTGKSELRWRRLGFQPYVTYLHMDKQQMIELAFPGIKHNPKEANEVV